MPYFLVDFRRFEPAQKPILELRSVYIRPRQDSNLRPEAPEASTLSTELRGLKAK